MSRGRARHRVPPGTDSTVNNIRYLSIFVQTADLSREAQYAANKDWLEAHLDEACRAMGKVAMIGHCEVHKFCEGN